MKLLKYFYLLCGLLFLQACSKDLGNYDYKAINDISVQGLLDGTHPTARVYELPFKQALTLSPVIEGTLSGSNMNDLVFEWKVDGETISNTKDMTYVADKKYGRLPVEFTVLDKSTSIEKSYNFFINVINPYKWGYYVLSKKSNGDAALYCKSSIQENSVFEEVLFPTLELGRTPLFISGVRKYGSSASDYYNVLTIGVKDATNPVVIVDSREFIPTLLYNSGSYVGGSDFSFSPTQVLSDPINEVVYTVNQGKLHVLRKGAIGLPVLSNDPMDYHIEPKGLVVPYNNGKYFFSFYDDRNKTIRVLDNGITANEYVYINRYDHVTPASTFVGQDFLAGSYANINGIRHIYLMKSGTKLISYLLYYGTTNQPSSLAKIDEREMPAMGTISMVNYDYPSNFWFMSIGKTIYRASHLGVDFQKFVELPASSKGNIVKYKVLQGKIMIATYDPDYSADKKSSVYIYNANTMELEQSLEYVTEEIVDIHIGI